MISERSCDTEEKSNEAENCKIYLNRKVISMLILKLMNLLWLKQTGLERDIICFN